MTAWKLIFLCLLPRYQAKDDGIYECGAHGRFEYCIDGIPGCVIGCHCHPGYYFDTESKICEPNTKLTQNYRRYVPEPTRVQNPVNLPEVDNIDPMPTLTTHNIIDKHVNDITKNADDLGDWLYNQFFKTIENQVINNTNKDIQLTRRSGYGSYGKRGKSKRRAKKRSKNRRRSKKKGMREKLLQITEDDSLFDSSGSSDSDDDSSSSDFSRSFSSTDSDSDEGHGHKKIVMINKKPQPPLPSFIFLPHMDTPFYPPIGLPPPPVMPMYPLVPVPPVMPAPPMFPFPGSPPECDESTTVTTTVTSPASTTQTTITTENLSTTINSDAQTDAGTSDVEELSTDAPAYSNRKLKKRKRMKSSGRMPKDEEELPLDNFNSPLEGRHKLIQRLRQRMNNPIMNNPSLKRNRKPLDNYPLTPSDNLMGKNNLDDMVFKNEKSLLGNIEDEPDEDNVDFKYLSQLIHRVNESQIRDAPVNVYNPRDSDKTFNPPEWSPKKKYSNFNVPIDSSRRMNQRVNDPVDRQSDDTYYSSLGKQIATLIRTIDADNERQLNIEIEKVQQKPDNPLFFNENAPRTFWERSVRSPIKYFYPFKNRYDYLKNSNELLFNIENKVETVASTVPTLSLQEIENMINVMQSAQTQFRSHTKIKNVKPSSKTLNINLWPQEIKPSKNSIKSSSRKNVFNVNKRKLIDYANKTRPEILNTKLNIIKVQNIHTFPNEDHERKLKEGYTIGLQMQPLLKSTSTNLYFVRNKTETTYSQPIQEPLNVHNSENLQHNVQHNVNPTTVVRNIKKYFFDDSNHFSFQNENLPFQYSVVKSVSKQPVHSLMPSPYFQHGLPADYISKPL